LDRFESVHVRWCRARVRQDSNLQPPDLESGALAVRATDPAGGQPPASALDLPLLVQRVAAARRTELFEGELVGRLLLVLGADVILPLAAVANERDQIAHPCPRLELEPTTGFEPVTSSLPRKC